MENINFLQTSITLLKVQVMPKYQMNSCLPWLSMHHSSSGQRTSEKKVTSHCIHVLGAITALSQLLMCVKARDGWTDGQMDGWMVGRNECAGEGPHLESWRAQRPCGSSVNQAATCPAGSQPPQSHHTRCSSPGHWGVHVHLCLGHGAHLSRPNPLSTLITINERTQTRKSFN